jgi:hypothetical protein
MGKKFRVQIVAMEAIVVLVVMVVVMKCGGS